MLPAVKKGKEAAASVELEIGPRVCDKRRDVLSYPA